VYYYFLVEKCKKPQCVSLGRCSQPCDRVFQLCCRLHRGSPAHCHLCLQIGQRCLTSRMLPVSRRLWRPEVSGTSLPHHPPSDLTISTSPGSYPCQYGRIPYWRGHESPQKSRNLPQDKPWCCYHRPLLSNEHFAINTLSLLHPLQYFLSNFAHFLIPKCYSFPSGKNLFVVWMPVLFYQKLCVVFRGITTIQLFLAQQDVPGAGTKLSINFEPFLVLDQ